MKRRTTLAGLGVHIAALAAPWTDAAHAQATADARPHRIGVLSVAPAASGFAQGVRRGLSAALREEGYEEGRNLEVDWRFGDGRADALPAMAAALVQSRAEVIVAVLNHEIAAAIAATRSIPIVMLWASLPVELGYVGSLSRPGGNVTGTTYTEPGTAAKNLQLLKELHPAARRLGILVNLNYPGMSHYRAESERAAPGLGLQLDFVEASHPDQVPAALERVAAGRPDAFWFAQDPVLVSRIPDIVAFARARRWASLGTTTQFVRAGGLMTYTPEATHLVRRTAAQVARILGGARPSEMPVEQPTRFLLVINQRTAREIGFTVPRSLLVRADEVIE